MTDNEIIKVLECCSDTATDCEECPLNGKPCAGILFKECLNIINRQKAEIERLKDEIRITQEYIHRNNLEYDLLAFSLAKKRLRDELAKEMVGAENGNTEKDN